MTAIYVVVQHFSSKTLPPNIPYLQCYTHTT